MEQIKRGLQIGCVQSSESSWVSTGSVDEEGTQIDLLIDRADQCINICEMKFAQSEFVIDKRYAKELETKLKVFQNKTQTRKALFLTMITVNGVKKNDYSETLVQNEVTAEALFA